MRQRIYAGLLLVSSLVLTIHCGSDDGTDFNDSDGSGGSGGSAGSGGSGGTTATSDGGNAGERGEPSACPDEIDFVPTALAQSICAKRRDCCADDIDTCMTEVVTALGKTYPDLAEAEEAETASLDCNAFDACALAIHEADCDDWPLQSGSLGGLPVDEPACLEIITPTATDGEECSYNYECIDGICGVAENETVGECDEFAEIGDVCDAVCDPVTMFCNSSNRCEARLANGDPCTKNDECESRICDLLGSGECVAPGPEQCKYVPEGIAHCAVAGAPGGRHASGWGALLVLAGLALSLGRRSRSE